MKILRIESATFGTLNITVPVAFGPGLNILTAPNQAGKSTLLTLVEWMLYGVPPHGKRRSQTAVDRWRPWVGGRVAATLVLQPGIPEWPSQVTLSVDFDDFTPRVTDAGTLTEVPEGLFTIDRNGSWDIGKQLTGLSREAFRLSLMAPQEEMESILKDEELRRLLTADLSDLVEDPERATLDHALTLLEKPTFTLGELSKGPVQMGKLLREATGHWQLAAGDLEHQQDRYRHLETELTQCELAESELGELNTRVNRVEQHLVQMDLAAARWRFHQVERMEQQGTEWASRVETDTWLKDFPAGLDRDVAAWSADRTNLREQLATAEAHAREAEAIKLRAPYVDKVNVDISEEVVRSQEKLTVLRNEVLTHSERLCECKDRLESIEAYLAKHKDKEDHVGRVPVLNEQLSAIKAATADREKAEELVSQFGEDRDAEERLRLEELDKLVKPYRASEPQINDYIEWSTGLDQSRTELEERRRALTRKAGATGQPLLITGIVLAVLGVVLAAVGHFAGVFAPWIGYAGGAVLLIGGVALVFLGFKKNGVAANAQAELEKEVDPALEEVAAREEKCRAQAQRIIGETGMSSETWQRLTEVVPEYRRLKLDLDRYAQALRDRESADDRRETAWEAVREAYPLAGDEIDAGWLAEQIGILREYSRHTQVRMDEHSKLRNEENELERAKRDQSEIMGRLGAEFEPLGLADTLKKDVDAAVSQFRKMVADARQWQEHQRDAAERERLKIREQDLGQKLVRLLAPVGLDAMAENDQEGALREFEVRKAESARFGDYDIRLAESREQLRLLGLEAAEFDARWQALSPEARRQIESAVTDEAGYDALVAKRKESGAQLEMLRREVEQKRVLVDKLRQSVARDEDARDALELASLKHYETKSQLEMVRVWQRALELVQGALAQIQQQLAGNLAPRLTEELQAVLTASPVQGVAAAGLSGQLELQLSVAGAPAGLSSAELLERLSVGARRQLALALRIAVARALGDNGATVMLLDEPLAELDDERAVNCLRYIGSLAAEHQVLLTTCHREHQAWLKRESGIEGEVVSLG